MVHIKCWQISYYDEHFNPQNNSRTEFKENDVQLILIKPQFQHCLTKKEKFYSYLFLNIIQKLAYFLMPCSCFNMGLFSSSTMKLIRTPQEIQTTSLFPESSIVTSILSTEQQFLVINIAIHFYHFMTFITHFNTKGQFCVTILHKLFKEFTFQNN